MANESTAAAASERWISELRERLHKQGNAQMVLQGEMLADRRVAEERHRQGAEQNAEIKRNLSSLSALVAGQGDTMTGVAQDLRSVLQRMDADEQTRIKTAAALEAADNARRQAEAGPWVTPGRVTTLSVALLVIGAFGIDRLG